MFIYPAKYIIRDFSSAAYQGKELPQQGRVDFFPLNSMQTIIFATGIQQFLTTAEPQLIDLWKTINF